MTCNYFFYGTLRHVPLLEAVLGHPVEARSARAAGFSAFHATRANRSYDFPVLAEARGASAEGIVVTLSAEDRRRLDYYEAGYQAAPIAVEIGAEPQEALTYRAPLDQFAPGAAWVFDDWQSRWGAIVTEAAAEFMSGLDHIPAAQGLGRFPMILARAASRLRARASQSPATLRRTAQPCDVEIDHVAPGYAHFFAVEDYQLRHRRFDGGQSETLDRAAFVSGDAACVLPYDPVRDRVLLIEQFRIGPMARGDRNPWLLEPVAGRVDPLETPEEAARREAVEEAGITLGDLIPTPHFYPTPAAKSEYLYCYIGLADLPDLPEGGGGLADEHEDIRRHLVSFDRLMELVETGEAENGPLLVIALWLARQRDRLRAQAGVERA